MELKIKLLYEDSILPVKAHPKDAAFDCFVHSIEYSSINLDKVKVGLGFAVEVPDGYMLNIVPRSSIGKFSWVLANSYGVIDSGYIQEVFAVFNSIPSTLTFGYDSNRLGVFELDRKIFPYEVGDRCCQMFLQELIPTDLKVVEEIKGSRLGFGSTGK